MSNTVALAGLAPRPTCLLSRRVPIRATRTSDGSLPLDPEQRSRHNVGSVRLLYAPVVIFASKCMSRKMPGCTSPPCWCPFPKEQRSRGQHPSHEGFPATAKKTKTPLVPAWVSCANGAPLGAFLGAWDRFPMRLYWGISIADAYHTCLCNVDRWPFPSTFWLCQGFDNLKCNRGILQLLVTSSSWLIGDIMAQEETIEPKSLTRMLYVCFGTGQTEKTVSKLCVRCVPHACRHFYNFGVFRHVISTVTETWRYTKGQARPVVPLQK